ncbi:MAG TPA: tetratricopeptide repeat protein [Terriglobia bacterium]|nr:tetratricopeptide repeat protein [Terriglobia bacterium]
MNSRFSLTVALLVFALQPVPSAFGVSKEIIQMQQQLQTLQQAVDNLQKTVDTQTAVLKTLIEQANDSVNSMKAQMAELQRTNGQNLATSNSRFDSVTGQIQALSESLEEAEGRLEKLSDQLAQTQNIIQTLNPAQSPPGGNNPPGGQNGSPPAGPNTGGSSTGAGPPPSRPNPDSLYKSGLSDYSAARYDLAIQEFQEYLQDYADTDLASNAQFYVGDSYYNQKKYAEAIDEFNKCLERYPKGNNKLAVAQLRKAYALIALGKTQAGERELRSLIKRFPSSHEADLARQRLKRLS